MLIGRLCIQLRNKMLFLVFLLKFISSFQDFALSLIRTIQITALSSDPIGKIFIPIHKFAT